MGTVDNILKTLKLGPAARGAAPLLAVPAEGGVRLRLAVPGPLAGMRLTVGAKPAAEIVPGEGSAAYITVPAGTPGTTRPVNARIADGKPVLVARVKYVKGAAAARAALGGYAVALGEVLERAKVLAASGQFTDDERERLGVARDVAGLTVETLVARHTARGLREGLWKSVAKDLRALESAVSAALGRGR
jgi:hypothetical protein